MQSKKELKQTVQDLISKAEIGEALELLANQQFVPIKDEVIKLKSRYSAHLQKQRKGIYGPGESDPALNNIIDALTDLVGTIDTTEKEL